MRCAGHFVVAAVAFGLLVAHSEPPAAAVAAARPPVAASARRHLAVAAAVAPQPFAAALAVRPPDSEMLTRASDQIRSPSVWVRCDPLVHLFGFRERERGRDGERDRYLS